MVRSSTARANAHVSVDPLKNQMEENAEMMLRFDERSSHSLNGIARSHRGTAAICAHHRPCITRLLSAPGNDS
eukprot:2538813-Pleurochrysis_carterae.AAC.1